MNVVLCCDEVYSRVDKTENEEENATAYYYSLQASKEILNVLWWGRIMMSTATETTMISPLPDEYWEVIAPALGFIEQEEFRSAVGIEMDQVVEHMQALIEGFKTLPLLAWTIQHNAEKLTMLEVPA